MTRQRKKLIEVSIPLEAINLASAREKSIRHGHPSTLHLWWARRPLAACRAVLFAQLVDDPSSWPERFGGDEGKIEAERKRLHKIIADMVEWPESKPEDQARFARAIETARWEIARSVAWGLGEQPPAKNDGRAILEYLQTKAPPVYDPFSGGGSIPLEAQRLGLRAYGSDLNPVAVLIGKALVEIPPKFAGRRPVNPKARDDSKHGELHSWKGAQGLAEDVLYYGQWMRDEAEKRIGHLYPKATLPDGSKATIMAWLWARTVRSPDPAAKGATVPLTSTFMLCTKDGRKAWVRPEIDPDEPSGWRFEVHSGVLTKEDEEELKTGTKTGRGSNFECILTGSVITPAYVREEGLAGRLGARLMAIVAEGVRSRTYLSPTTDQEDIAASANPGDTTAIEIAMSDNPRWFSPPGYGMKRYVDIFTKRQLAALTTFSDIVLEARTKALSDARAAGLTDEITPLHAGGAGAVAYADAVATYLAFSVTNVSDRNATVVGWANNREHVRNVFSRQAIPMVWDFCESNVFSDSSGNFFGGIEKVYKALGQLGMSGLGGIKHQVAQTNSFSDEPVVISTDPPYYDNIGYADLSDYFYVWLRRSSHEVWPDLFRRLSTPKSEELVATPHRHGGTAGAEAFFMQGMGEALTAMRKAATQDEPLAIYYAFRQSEAAQEGVTSAGWASFLQAVVSAGLTVDGTWPVRTELERRFVGKDANALASSIVLVCRKRISTASIIPRAEFIRILKREMPDAIGDIRKAGVGPVDMQQSVIGPGMGVFTRYSKVLEDDDSAMNVKTALVVINRVWEEIDNELDAAFDAETQVALAWFATYSFDAKPSGELITLANAKNVSLNTLFASGVFKDFHGKAGLTPRLDLPKDWSPRRDRTLTVWECVQHTARVLKAEDGGGEAAAQLVREMGAKAADSRTLAYRLYEICSQKGWQQEALVYNELAQEWPALEDLAQNLDTGTEARRTAQAELF